MRQMVWVVIYYSTLIGVYTCAVDAMVVSNLISGSTVHTCLLNSETDTGKELLPGITDGIPSWRWR
eukprot:COSAG03_NODE_5379_length_1264_cov_1.239485_2_plen_66_part_00